MTLEGKVFTVEARCTACGRRHALGRIYRCEACEGPLDIRYDYDAIPRDAFDPTRATRSRGIWVHRELLPVSPSHIVSLGEGQTPLLPCDRLGARLGLSALWVKDETREPTGSFKDRPLSVAVSKARELGAEVVVTASSGNAAASMAAYASRAGMRAVVLVPADTPPAKLFQIVSAGARIVRIRGSVSDSMGMARATAGAFGWYNVTTTYENPYSVEGDKTVAYELAAALDWRSPHWIIVPVGSGPLLAGIWKGFLEMQRAGLVRTLPRMVAAQAEGCAPIARSFKAGEESVEPWASPRTVATGIQDPLAGYAQDGTYTLRVVRQSQGRVTDAPDEAILEAVRLMAELEGLYVEPTVGAATAAAAALREAEVVTPEDEVVVVSTGHGLKQPFAGQEELARLPEIAPDLKALQALGLTG